VISQAGVAIDPNKIQAVLDWPMPQNIKQLRGFVGIIGYYKRFIKGYGTICWLLTQLLKKDAFKWDATASEAFNHLKRAMPNPPVLALPDPDKLFIIENDASGNVMRVVLMQEGHPLVFINKTWGPRQQALSTYEREMLVIL